MQLRIPSRLEWLRVFAVLLLSASVGCAHVNDPFRDSGAAVESEMTTASSEGYQGKSEFESSSRRSWPQSTVTYANGAVTHWPLASEDPFEDKGNGLVDAADRDAPDNEFAWNWVDWAHLAMGPARMGLNLVGLPLTGVITHPGMLMESDGRLSEGLGGYQHDAKKADSVSREPPDVNHITQPEDEYETGLTETAQPAQPA